LKNQNFDKTNKSLTGTLKGIKESKNNGLNYALEKTIFPNDASNGLSYSKMQYHMNKNHCRILTHDPESKFNYIDLLAGKEKFMKRSYCKSSTGWPCCCKEARKSEFY